jgi:hypothetical protein
MKKLILLIIVLFITANPLFAQLDYNPMSVGNYWIQHSDSFGDGFNPTTFRTDVEAIDLIKGKEFFRMRQEQSLDNGSQDPSIWYIWNGQDASGGLIGAFGSDPNINLATIYDPPLLSFPKEATYVGYTWEYDFPGTGVGTQHWNCLLESLSETVVVPAGTYNNCTKASIVITNKDSKDTMQTSDFYYANGVGQVLNEGWSLYSGNYRFELTEYYLQPPLKVNESPVVPFRFYLRQNYPNPFNPVTTISYQLLKSAIVNLSVYDAAGQLVETLVNEQKKAGYYSAEWNAEKVASGVYYYRIITGEFTETKKAVYLK